MCVLQQHLVAPSDSAVIVSHIDMLGADCSARLLCCSVLIGLLGLPLEIIVANESFSRRT